MLPIRTGRTFKMTRQSRVHNVKDGEFDSTLTRPLNVPGMKSRQQVSRDALGLESTYGIPPLALVSNSQYRQAPRKAAVEPVNNEQHERTPKHVSSSTPLKHVGSKTKQNTKIKKSRKSRKVPFVTLWLTKSQKAG